MLTTNIMRTVRISLVSGLLLAALVSGLALEASAAEVRAGLSARETYVGLPITLQIQVSNATDLDPPTIPEIDGLEIKSLGTPSRNTQIMTVNGKTTTNASVVFAYQMTPQRAGNFHIPAITVHADGRQQQTRAIDFVVSKSETGDLLFAEIAGKENQIYVGQALDVTLKIWLRPYRDSERGITLSEADMWRMISERTTWGAFEERIQQLADERQRPAGKEVLRKDRAGVEHSYYLYEISATIYPKRPGKIDANDVKVIVDYPTALGKSRDPFAGFFADMPGGPAGLLGDDDLLSSFGSRLTVRSVRPIVAEVKVDSIEVLPIPTAGRPDDYRGAVGKIPHRDRSQSDQCQSGRANQFNDWHRRNRPDGIGAISTPRRVAGADGGFQGAGRTFGWVRQRRPERSFRPRSVRGRRALRKSRPSPSVILTRKPRNLSPSTANRFQYTSNRPTCRAGRGGWPREECGCRPQGDPGGR